MTTEEKSSARCHRQGCTKPSKKKCTGCKLTGYCSKECQSLDWKDGHRKKCPEMKLRCKYCLIRKPEDYHEKGLCVHCGELFCCECVMSKKYVEVGKCPACQTSVYHKSDEVCYTLLKRLEEKAEKILSDVSSEGNVDERQWAERALTYIYICVAGRWYRGEGVERNLDNAEAYYIKAVDRGSKLAHYNLYCLYQDRGNPREECMAHLMIAADDSYPVAQLTYSMELRVQVWDIDHDLCQKIRRYITRGDVIQLFKEEPDLETTCMEQTPESYDYLKRAALNGLPDALFELGIAFQFGQAPDHAITRDMTDTEKQEKLHKLIKMSIIWYVKAAQKGHGLAANNLGVIYKNGLGCIGDIEKAKEYYIMSHLAGCENGTHGLGTVHEQEAVELETVAKALIDSGSDATELIKEKEENYRKAASFYASAGSRGFLPAQFQLGYLMVTNRFYREGEASREKHLLEGFHLIKEAAQKGCRHAQNYIYKLREENGEGPESKEIIDPRGEIPKKKEIMIIGPGM